MQLKMTLWKVIGILAYYIMFLSLGAVTGFVAFLLGLAFGAFWASPRTQMAKSTNLDFLTEMYFVLGFPFFVIVWSGLYFAAPSGVSDLPVSSKVFVSISGILLFYVSYFFATQAFGNRNAPRRLRLCIVFGPIICGGLTGLAGTLLALSSYGIISESSWWISLVILVISLVSAIVAFILLILLALEHPTGRPPLPRQMAG